ncbi:HAD-IA family hydrolase [Halobellus ruber]|uniref:HAD family hydrolase n=1 Tax=Halobellus ruber TaxID=2761102 RepID=A0A7J9SP11_9EURY|nr:HAD family hydrolase [Halobellus ruber]
MTITAVGFDLDETLAVPARDRETILEEAVGAVDGPPLTRERYLDAHSRNLTGDTREPIFESLLAAHDTDVEPERLAAVYRRKIADALAPVSDVEPFLRRLRGIYRIGLLTNGPTVAQRDKLTTLGWTDLFDAALVTGDLDAGKPAPAAFEALLGALDSDPEETVYVGDDVDADVGGAAEAGLVPVQVTFEGGPSPSPRAAAHVPRDRLVAELPELLESL